MKCEPITDLGFAMAATRTGLRARITFLVLTARRTRAMPVFAALAKAVVRAGLARRTIFRTGRLCAAVRVRAMLRLATVLRRAVVRRFAIVLRRAVVRRFAAMLRLAVVVRLAAVLRAGLARRIVFRAVVFARTTRRFREGLFFAVRFRDVLDLLNITTYPPQLKVSRPSLLWVNTV